MTVNQIWTAAGNSLCANRTCNGVVTSSNVCCATSNNTGESTWLAGSNKSKKSADDNKCEDVATTHCRDTNGLAVALATTSKARTSAENADCIEVIAANCRDPATGLSGTKAINQIWKTADSDAECIKKPCSNAGTTEDTKCCSDGHNEGTEEILAGTGNSRTAADDNGCDNMPADNCRVIATGRAKSTWCTTDSRKDANDGECTAVGANCRDRYNWIARAKATNEETITANNSECSFKACPASPGVGSCCTTGSELLISENKL